MINGNHILECGPRLWILEDCPIGRLLLFCKEVDLYSNICRYTCGENSRFALLFRLSAAQLRPRQVGCKLHQRIGSRVAPLLYKFGPVRSVRRTDGAKFANLGHWIPLQRRGKFGWTITETFAPGQQHVFRPRRTARNWELSRPMEAGIYVEWPLTPPTDNRIGRIMKSRFV